MCRWEQCAGESLGERRAQKGGPQGEPHDHGLGRSRGGLTSKFHLVTDGGGLPLAVDVSAGQCHDSTRFEEVMNVARRISAGWPRWLLADKAYSIHRIRDWLEKRSILLVRPIRNAKEFYP